MGSGISGDSISSSVGGFCICWKAEANWGATPSPSANIFSNRAAYLREEIIPPVIMTPPTFNVTPTSRFDSSITPTNIIKRRSYGGYGSSIPLSFPLEGGSCADRCNINVDASSNKAAEQASLAILEPLASAYDNELGFSSIQVSKFGRLPEPVIGYICSTLAAMPSLVLFFVANVIGQTITPPGGFPAVGRIGKSASTDLRILPTITPGSTCSVHVLPFLQTGRGFFGSWYNNHIWHHGFAYIRKCSPQG